MQSCVIASRHAVSFHCVLLVIWTAATVATSWAEESSQVTICRFDDHQVRNFGIELEGDERRYAPDRVADILHLRLDVTPDFLARTVAGTTRLEFQPIAKPLQELTLDAVDLTVRAVRSDCVVADHTNSGRKLTIRFATPIPVGQRAYVEIDHQAQPAKGFYFRTPEMGYPAGDIHVWTQGETHEARFWFPCFDYPNERSTTEVICHVPSDMIVLSNGRQVEESTDAQGLKRVHWRQDVPHVNYLICLVAGKFHKLEKSHRDIPLAFYTQPSLAEHAANAFADTEKIMAFYEQEIGVPFPWNKYDQVTIVDFIAGGMENTTLTTLTDHTIFSSATENLHSSRQLDAHEMAHQWFGDYVTCKDWGHLWLNEGFASYYTHLYEGHCCGHDAMLYGLYQDAEDRVLPQSKDTRGIVYRDYKNPGEQFDYRSYPKGSWVLHMLRSQLGPDLFRSCIREYLTQHALGNVVSDDLRQVVEARSGRSFDRFFDQWVYHGGNPEVTVRYDWRAAERMARVTVRQKRRAGEDLAFYAFPTKLRFVVDGQSIDSPIEISEEEHEFFVPLPGQPEIVRFDPDTSVLVRVEFDVPEAMLLAQLRRPDDMIGRLVAARALGERSTPQSVAALQQTLNDDAFFGVRIQASQSLRKLDTAAAREALVASLNQPDARVRQQVVADLLSPYREDTFERIVQVLNTEQNPEIQATAIRALGRHLGQDTRRLILQYLHTDSFRQVLTDAAIHAIAAQQSSQFRPALLSVVRARGPQFTSPVLGNALQTLAQITPTGRQRKVVRDLLLEHTQDPRLPIRLAAIRALGQLKDPSTRGVLESLANSTGQPDLSNGARHALDQLNATARIAPQEVIELRDQVSQLRRDNDTLKKDIESLRAQMEALGSERSTTKD